MSRHWWVEKRGSQWQVQTAHRGPGSSFCIAPINHWSDDAEGTARLIAAAPALLEALERMIGPAGYTGDNSITQQARAAIAKARGEEVAAP